MWLKASTEEHQVALEALVHSHTLKGGYVMYVIKGDTSNPAHVSNNPPIDAACFEYKIINGKELKCQH